MDRIYELEQRIAYYKMQRNNLDHKDTWSKSDYEWSDKLRDNITNLENWIKEIQAESVRVTSAGEIIEDGILRTAVLHD